MIPGAGLQIIKVEFLLQFAVALLNEFGNNCRTDADHWGDYVSEGDIRDWLQTKGERNERD